ncbi:crossover junction endodeoxyribonuclease RuvC [Candidatus Gottesmanbacteria bacterium]|nr:crossover junction endodeoxyribonuclease RuvC [Candidatus Gottesmanbacteria bacterium]
MLPTKILGIDPGFGRMGWGVIANSKGKQNIISFGCLETNPKSPHEARISQIYHEVLRLISLYKPHVVALEELFFGSNITTALKVGESRGVIMLATHDQKIPLFIYKPIEVKMAVSGYGRAEKSQVQLMVKIILKLKSIPKPDDAADALAIALTHCFSYKLSKLKTSY